MAGPLGHVMGPDDVRITWNPKSQTAVKAARTMWETYKAQGYELWTLAGDQLMNFDPAIGEAVAVPTIPPPEIVAKWAKRNGPP